MPRPADEKRTLLATALCAAALVAVLYALLGVWPFGGGSVLTGDLNGQYINYNASFARALRAGGDGFFYSFEKHMGGSLLGILAYYCASPFNLLYLLCDVSHYAQMAGVVLAAKLVCMCTAMAFFLGRHTPSLRHRAVLPALCWGFCAYAVVYAQNVMWLDVLILLPLICWGIDVLWRTGRPFAFSLWLALAIFANFYIAYMACIFAVLYFLYLPLAQGMRGACGAQACADAPLRGERAAAGVLTGTPAGTAAGASAGTHSGTPAGTAADAPAGTHSGTPAGTAADAAAGTHSGTPVGTAAGASAGTLTDTPAETHSDTFVKKPAGALRGLFARRCGSFAFGALCAGGLAAALLVPALADIRASKGLASGFALTGQASFKFSEFFYRLLPFNFTWADVQNGLPNVYCGALCVVLTAVYFCAAGIPRREKAVSAAMTAALFLSLFSADAMLAMHGFVHPVWFPYRHSFLFSFWLCFLAAQALGRARMTWPRWALAAGAGCAFLAVCFLVRNEWFTATLFGAGALLCAGYCALLFALQRAGSRRVRAACLALCGALCCAELTANAFYEANQFEKYSAADFAAFTAQGTQMRAALAQQADGRAYRAEKTWFRSLNDPMLLDYAGLSHFGSTQNTADADWVGRMGFGTANRYGDGSTAFGEALTGLRWVFGKDGDSVPAHLAARAQQDGMTLYENSCALPLAFYTDESTLTRAAAVPAYDWTAVQTFDTQNAVFAALTGSAKPLLTDITAVTAAAEGKETPLTGDFDKTLVYTVQVPQDGLVYAVLASKQGRPVQYETSTGFAGGTFSGYPTGVIQLGRCRAGDTVTLTLTAEWGLMDVSAARFAVLDETALQAYTAAAQAAAPASQTLTRGSLTVQTANSADSVLALLVPYDENLRVTVDGTAAACLPLFDDLCAVRVPAGSHTVRVGYRVPHAAAGLAVSACAAAALLGAAVRTRRRAGTVPPQRLPGGKR